MEIIVDLEGSTPLFSQLVEQIKHAVASKKLAAGDPLPSIRQLGNDLDINNKTVAKAYKLLERDQIIESKGYRGSFVREGALDNCNINLNELINEKLEKTIIELKKINATDSEIRIAFANLMNNQK